MNNNPNTSTGAADTEVPAFPYHYYLSVIDFQDIRITTGELELNRARPIRTMDDVREVKQWLRDTYGYKNPNVSFSLLRNDLAGRKPANRPTGGAR